jgi:TRAP-type C4-dicarboxylate transport system permease small subunit
MQESAMLDKIFGHLNRAFEILIFVLFLLIVIVGGMQVFNRFVLNQSLSWSEEFMVYAHIWMIFLAIPVAYNRGSHIGMNLFIKGLPPRKQLILTLAVDVMWVVLAAAIVFYTSVVMGVASNQNSPALGLRMDRAYLGLVVGGTFLGLLALRKVVASVCQLRSGATPGGATC